MSDSSGGKSSAFDSKTQRWIDTWKSGGGVAKLWAGDAGLWTAADESRWTGWLDEPARQLRRPEALETFREEVRAAGFSHALLLGMGGSSLCPEVLSLCFGRREGFPELAVLDSTDPAQIASVAARIDLGDTLFFVSSKSGATLEPDILRRYFFDLVGRTLGRRPGDRFVAVTDPGSKLEEIAARDGYREIFYGVPEIGGRYSALSNFGMAPAAALGLDVKDFLARAERMAAACRNEDPAANPGVSLGLFLGAQALAGRDKLTFIASEGLRPLGAWLEQLIAESTGKEGKAIIPVDLENVGTPNVYGDDRVFAVLQLGGEEPRAEAVRDLEAAGRPVVRTVCADIADLGQEFFRWEVATATAGSVLGINPFNQPDVEASKIAARRLTEQYEATRSLPSEQPFFEADGVRLFADSPHAARLARGLDGPESLAAYLRAHLETLGAGDYFGLLAYVEMNEAHVATLQKIRHKVRDARRTATCLGFGPRFLHSTGQAYKGGPNSGVFIQVTCDDAADLGVPGKKYTFGVVKTAQARGDFEVLRERGRRALRVHLDDVEKGLKTLTAAVERALGPE